MKLPNYLVRRDFNGILEREATASMRGIGSGSISQYETLIL